ncbi:MAG: T9SS type A sorting domain-containing protein [Bacteroidales bacterium]|nr:T9SS type A sorting domain-containing protein [Bacteroidales bacterium]
MQKLIILILIFIGSSVFTQSQPLEIQWQQCYGSSDNDFANDMVLYDNHYYIVGSTNAADGDVSSLHGGDDIWLIKTDTLGHLIWEKTFGGSGYDAGYGISRSGKDLIIAGTSGSTDGDVENSPYEASNFWVIKVDTSGRLLWEKMFGGNYRDEVIRSTGTHDGGIIAVGCTASDDGDVSNYYYLWDGWVVKLDSTGKIEWDYTIGTTMSNDYSQAVIQTSDSGFLVGSASWAEGSGSIHCQAYENTAEAILFKFDKHGEVEWQRCYGGSNHEGVYELIECDDGYIFTSHGGSDDGDCEGCGYHSVGYPNQPSDVWTVKTDFQGNIQWHRCYGGSGDDYLRNIFPVEQYGGYILFGRTYSTTEYGPNGDVSDNPSISQYNPSLWVIQIDSTGELMYERCIGGEGEDWMRYAVVQKNWHTYMVAGMSTWGPSHDVACDIYDEHENFWLFELRDKSVGMPEIAEPESKLKAYPNPAKKQVTFTYTLARSIKQGTLEIRNPSGTLMKRMALRKPNGEKSVSTRHWSPGIYFYTLRTNDDITSGKLVIVK